MNHSIQTFIKNVTVNKVLKIQINLEIRYAVYAAIYYQNKAQG